MQVEIRTGSSERGTYRGKKTAVPAFILSKKYKTNGNQQIKKRVWGKQNLSLSRQLKRLSISQNQGSSGPEIFI